MKIKEVMRLSAIPVLFASLCCLAPVILVTFGLASVTLAASLATTLYGTYRWAFRFAGFALLAISIIMHLRRQKGICTIDDAVRRKNEIMNIVALTIIGGVLGYVFFLYIVVHYAGVFLKIWP